MASNHLFKERTVRLVYFGHNRKDAALIRRIESFIDIGVNVTSYTFRRDGEPKEPGPTWENVDLGIVEHAQLLARIKVLLAAIIQTIRYKKYVQVADIVYARNLDMALIAWLSTLILCREPVNLVYECLDVHEALTKKGFVAKTLRWLERIILKRAKLLVVSSPGFIHHYFKPCQRYAGEFYLIENKLYFHNDKISRPSKSSLLTSTNKPIVLVWAGNLRCQKTLDALMQLASAAQENIYIRFHGVISDFLIPDFEKQIQDITNIEYRGPYCWPDGLQEVYQDADLVWAQELSWKGHNSDWLIPNRIYEASYFGVVSIAVSGTQTAMVIKERGLGYVIDEHDYGNLSTYIMSIDKKEINNKKINLLGRDDQEFVTSKEDIKLLVDTIL